jgi:LacI family transcriptional regulator
MKNPATLKKISDHLSVSISTVSRALKDHQDVSPETKRRVKELAEMLDYEPNSFAINLRKKHSDLFAVVVPEISSYFYHSFIEAIEEEARSIGYSIMILQSMNDTELEKNNLKLCRYNHVAGVFLAVSNSGNNAEAFRKMEDWDIPVVFFDKVPEDGTFNKVCLADYQMGRLAAEKMLACGKQKILAIMGDTYMSITQRREKGLRDYLAEHAPDMPFEVVYAQNEEQADQRIEAYINQSQPPTVVFTMSDEVLCGAIRAINRFHLKMPSDISLLTVSNGFLPRLFSPEIAYLETNGKKLGKLSFHRMKEIMDGKKFIRENFLECHFHAGGSL